MRQEGISAEESSTSFCRKVARKAGRRWMDDEISFADVTIVTARLQETVRAFGRVPRGGHQTRTYRGDGAGQCAGARPADHSAPRGTYARRFRAGRPDPAPRMRGGHRHGPASASDRRKGAENALSHGRNNRVGAQVPCIGKRIGGDHQGFRHTRDTNRAWRKRSRGRERPQGNDRRGPRRERRGIGADRLRIDE
jgi:hypothetical protein